MSKSNSIINKLISKVTPMVALQLYILCIFVFANAYFWIAESLPKGEDTIFHALYFSVVTITTLGYGDI